MSMDWFYYSEYNIHPEELEKLLTEKNQDITSFKRLDDLKARLALSSSSILFLQTHGDVYELCEEISIQYPDVYIILLKEEKIDMKKAMHAGASNILRMPVQLKELIEVVFQAQRYMNFRAIHKTSSIGDREEDCQVISVCSPLGGVGRSFLTINLAASYARQGKLVAVLDTDIQFGDVSMYLDIKPKKTMYEWVKEGYERGQYSIDGYMSKHESGVAILSTPPRPEFFELITEEHIQTAITELKKEYEIIIIDTPAFISEILLKSLTLSDHILLLTTGDLPALRKTRLFIDTLETLNLSEKMKLVLNRDSKNRVIDVKKVQDILQRALYSTLPEQTLQAAASINEGAPIILKTPKSPLSKSILTLSSKLVSNNEDETSSNKSKRWALLSR